MQDYLIQNDGNLAYHKRNCERCFKFVNQCLNFMSADLVCILKVLIFTMQLSPEFVNIFIPIFVLIQLFFPICKDGHQFVFVVAIRDGYFVFLDSFFEENDLFQEQARSIIVSYKHHIILFWELHIYFCSSVVFDFLKIPNFLKAWDEFIGYNYDFENFVIHYCHTQNFNFGM